MRLPELVSLSYSPWSEKARWALDHHGIEYRNIAYTPMLGVPRLRMRLRAMRAKITVPILAHTNADEMRDQLRVIVKPVMQR